MESFILAFYGILLLSCFFATIFVVFHIARYSLNRASAGAAIGMFLITTGFLIIANIILFQSVRWNQVFADILNTSL